jgi:mutator protein MutT
MHSLKNNTSPDLQTRSLRFQAAQLKQGVNFIPMKKSSTEIIPVLAAIIFNAEGKILIARRRKGISQELKWEFPGGKLRAGESPEFCLMREINEELGIDIEIRGIFHAVNHSYPDKNILLVAFLTELKSGEIRLKDHCEISWMELSALADYDFSLADIPIVEKLQSSRS